MQKTIKKKVLVKDDMSKEKSKTPIKVNMEARKLQKRKSFVVQGPVYKTLEKEDEAKVEKSKIKLEPLFSYVNFLPNGKHYFYFIKNGKYYCLSNRYPVRQFK